MSSDELQNPHQAFRTSEAEQRRIGRDIHDDICQNLAGISCLVQALRRQSTEDEATRDAWNEIDSMIRETNARARELARGLVPVVLESEGLRDALAELAASSSNSFSVDCHLLGGNGRADVEIADADQRVHLFRIAQEAIRNAVRHGDAKIIEIGLRHGASGSVVLSIADNGGGIPGGKPDSNRGIGLITMQQRAKMMSGNLRIENQDGSGTLITCEIPQR